MLKMKIRMIRSLLIFESVRPLKMLCLKRGCNFHWFIMIQFKVQDILNFIGDSQKHMELQKESSKRLKNLSGLIFCLSCNQLSAKETSQTLLSFRGNMLQSFFQGFELIIKLRKMEEFIEESHKQRKETKLGLQAPFIVVYNFRHLIAKQRKKALRKANNQRKKMLIHTTAQADAYAKGLESKRIENQWDQSLWDVFILEEVNKSKSQLSSFNHLIQSQQISILGDWSSQKSQKNTSIGQITTSKKEIFAQQFLAFRYL